MTTTIRLFILSGLLLICNTATAQVGCDDVYPPANYSQTTLDAMPLSDEYGSDANRFHEWLGLPQNESLVEYHRIQSLTGEHISFDHLLNGRKILNSGLKVHVSHDGTVFVQNYLTIPGKINMTNVPPEFSFMATENGIVPVFETLIDTVNRPYYEYQTPDGLVVHSQYVHSYFKDTTAVGYVHYANPTNSANTTYGGRFVDNNDQNNPSLEAERFLVEFPVRWENDTFYLESQWFRFAEVSEPFEEDLHKSANDTFDYTRDQPSFEAVNAYYHLTSIAEYLNKTGFRNLLDTISIDVHALDNMDQSRFHPSNFTIECGQGGVDDAEDGEVVIHEYFHSLQQVADPFPTRTNQRIALDEGACDYFAKAYSRSLIDNNSYQMFSWDGHNEYWDGFVLDDTKRYPHQYDYDLYGGDREMWSSTLMCIHDQIGRDAMDSLVLEHLFYQFEVIEMPAMVDIVLKMDSLLFGAKYHNEIKTCMAQRGFFPCYVQPDQKEILVLKNSLAFALGTGNLTISTKDPVSLRVYDNLGQVVYQVDNTDNCQVPPSLLPIGFYLLEIKTSGERFVEKVLRIE